MCLTCGCMQAHKEMGQHNLTYEHLKRAADENDQSVEDILRTLEATAAKDRADHADEYAASAAARGAG